MRTNASLLISVVIAVAGCEVDAGTSVEAAESYELTTDLDLTATAILPDPAYEVIQHLERLRDDPASELFALLDAAGVPLLSELMAALPAVVEDEIVARLNAAIGARVLDGTPFGAAIDEILAVAGTTLAGCTLISDLDVADETHTVREARFDVAGQSITVALAGLPDPASILEDDAPVTITGERIAIGEHSFGLAYGEIAYAALEAAAEARWGMGLRDALGAIVDCDAVAADVAGQCVLGVCIGHADLLRDVCEAGLDELTARIHAELAAQRFDAVRFIEGGADLLDADGDAVAESLAAGIWEAEIDVGLGPRPAPASFTGAMP